jgi:ferric-dicitrate binding protein FerR (iron transport regulator)
MNDSDDNNDDNNNREADRDIAQLLGAAGPRESVPDELKERWERHFRSELATVKRARSRRRVLPLLAAAASIVAVAIMLRGPADTAFDGVPAQIVAITGSVEVLSADATRQPVSEGQTLEAGLTLETGDSSQLGMAWAGFDIRLNERTRLRLSTDRLHLELGEVYISSVGQVTALASAIVVTPLATVRDIGTQFKVQYDGQSLTTGVREGSIEVQTPRTTQRVSATGSSRQSLHVSGSGEVRSTPDDSDWTWIYSVSQPFSLEGQSVLAFLEWAADESGRELTFADSAARLSAGYTRFSGEIDLRGLDPEQAVSTVMSTTRFEVTALDGALRVKRRDSE